MEIERQSDERRHLKSSCPLPTDLVELEVVHEGSQFCGALPATAADTDQQGVTWGRAPGQVTEVRSPGQLQLRTALGIGSGHPVTRA